MVNKCAAYGCTSGYKTNKDAADSSVSAVKVTFHSFPIHNKVLCDKWVRANPRLDFTPSKHSKLCSLHFKASDFVEGRQDSNKSRKQKKTGRSGTKLAQRYLKSEAVPSIFQHAPTYLSSSNYAEPRQTVNATSARRMQNEANRLHNLEESFLASDVISALSNTEIIGRLKEEAAIPRGYQTYN